MSVQPLYQAVEDRAKLLPAPEGAEVDMWTWSLRASAASRAASDVLLSDEERARAGAFIFDHDRDAFVVAHGEMRRILGRYLSMSPASIPFATGAQGKPQIAVGATRIFFNLSHSGDRALLAVSRSGEVGADIELIRPLGEPNEWGFLSDIELHSISQLEASARLEAGFQIWTRKEALLKALGCGLMVDPCKVSVLEDRIATRDFIPDARPESWRVLDLRLGSGYVGAVALSASIGRSGA